MLLLTITGGGLGCCCRSQPALRSGGLAGSPVGATSGDLAAATPAAGVTVPWISDIHFNPFFDPDLFPALQRAPAEQWPQIFATSTVTGYGTLGTDETNYHLLDSALRAMATTATGAPFALFTGDLLAHSFADKYESANNGSRHGQDEFIYKTVSFVVLLLNRHLPGLPVYLSLGNNDSYAGDYAIKPGGLFLEQTTPLFAEHLLRDPANRSAFAATYRQHGCYSIKAPGPSPARIISLNTILFSPKHPADSGSVEAAHEQLAWLETELNAAEHRGEKVWLLLHIPPGGDIFGLVKHGSFIGFWQEQYTSHFLAVVAAHASVVTACFAGHTHMDDYRLLNKPGQDQAAGADAFLRICPAVSPQFGNNPGFTTLLLDPDSFTLRDLEVSSLDLGSESSSAAWAPEYRLGNTFDLAGVSPRTMQELHAEIAADQQVRSTYFTLYDVSSPDDSVADDWHAYWCGAAHLLSQELLTCFHE